MNGKWQIAGQAVYSRGSYKIGGSGDFRTIDSIAQFYRDTLNNTAVDVKKAEKFFRIGEQSAITIAMALLILRQSGMPQISDFSTTAIIGYGKDGSHHGNLTYWNDYVDNGKQAGSGHLFVGTLASTPLCQLALTMGCHAPVYYFSADRGSLALRSELEFICDQCDNLFLMELDVDYCNCMLLRRSNDGVGSEEIIRLLEANK